MGKKYIIELDDKPFRKENGDFLYRIKGFNSLVFDLTGISKLTPYTEPDLDAIKQEEYEKGYKTAKVQCDIQTEKDLREVGERHYQKGYQDATVKISSNEQAIAEKAYQRGLNDAWEAARTLWNTSNRKAIFGYTTFSVTLTTLTAQEAIEKIRQYEQEKEQEEQIQIGDEVIRHYKNEFMEGDDAPSIFLSEEDGNFRCLAFNGRSIMIAEYPKNQYRKTGRHFPEIAEVLQKMREADNG